MRFGSVIRPAKQKLMTVTSCSLSAPSQIIQARTSCSHWLHGIARLGVPATASFSAAFICIHTRCELNTHTSDHQPQLHTVLTRSDKPSSLCTSEARNACLSSKRRLSKLASVRFRRRSRGAGLLPIKSSPSPKPKSPSKPLLKPKPASSKSTTTRRDIKDRVMSLHFLQITGIRGVGNREYNSFQMMGMMSTYAHPLTQPGREAKREATRIHCLGISPFSTIENILPSCCEVACDGCGSVRTVDRLGARRGRARYSVSSRNVGIRKVRTTDIAIVRFRSL